MLTIAGGILIAFFVISFLPQLIKLGQVIFIAFILIFTILVDTSNHPEFGFVKLTPFIIGAYFLLKLIRHQYRMDKLKHPNSYPIWKL